MLEMLTAIIASSRSYMVCIKLGPRAHTLYMTECDFDYFYILHIDRSGELDVMIGDTPTSEYVINRKNYLYDCKLASINNFPVGSYGAGFPQGKNTQLRVNLHLHMSLHTYMYRDLGLWFGLVNAVLNGQVSG